MTGQVSSDTGRRAGLALLLLVPAPSIGTYLAMVHAPGEWWAKALFFLLKAWLLLLPLVWLMLVDRQPGCIPLPRRKGMTAACISGSIIFLAIALAYLLAPETWIDADRIREGAIEAGFTTPMLYLLGAIYWCTINALLEEYVWRWFVFTRCEALLPRWPAVFCSALFFTLHHVIALSLFFDWHVTMLASLGVFLGGATWSWLYLQYRNIYAAYVSHVFADVIIFLIGYQIIFG